MKVYAVYSGSYSDRMLEAIFSTKKNAQQYINTLKTFNVMRYDDVDDKPIEYTVDDTKKLEYACFMVGDNGKIEKETYYNHMFQDIIFNDGYYHVRVKYNPDVSVMYKAVRDKIAQYKANKEGV